MLLIWLYCTDYAFAFIYSLPSWDSKWIRTLFPHPLLSPNNNPVRYVRLSIGDGPGVTQGASSVVAYRGWTRILTPKILVQPLYARSCHKMLTMLKVMHQTGLSRSQTDKPLEEISASCSQLASRTWQAAKYPWWILQNGLGRFSWVEIESPSAYLLCTISMGSLVFIITIQYYWPFRLPYTGFKTIGLPSQVLLWFKACFQSFSSLATRDHHKLHITRTKHGSLAQNYGYLSKNHTVH